MNRYNREVLVDDRILDGGCCVQKVQAKMFTVLTFLANKVTQEIHKHQVARVTHTLSLIALVKRSGRRLEKRMRLCLRKKKSLKVSELCDGFLPFTMIHISLLMMPEHTMELQEGNHTKCEALPGLMR